jgi:hypothetical protein
MTRTHKDQLDLFAWTAPLAPPEAASAREASEPAPKARRGKRPAAPIVVRERQIAEPDTGDADLVVDFLVKRESLPRWILARPSVIAGIDRAIARKDGLLAPTPILRLPVRHPASPGAYSAEPSRRSGSGP